MDVGGVGVLIGLSEAGWVELDGVVAGIMKTRMARDDGERDGVVWEKGEPDGQIRDPRAARARLCVCVLRTLSLCVCWCVAVMTVCKSECVYMCVFVLHSPS